MILMIAASCSNMRETKKLYFSDLKRNDIDGDVISIKTSIYECDSLGTEIQLKDCCTTLENYDENGLRVKSISWKANGDTLFSEEIESFENGLAKSVSTWVKNQMMRQMVFTLNDSGYYKSFVVYDSARNIVVQGINVHQTDFGTLKSFQLVDGNQKLLQTEVNEYENGHLKSSIKLNPAGDTVSLYQAIYNSKGEGVEERYYYIIDGKSVVDKIQRHTYSDYDEFGNWRKQIQFDESGNATQITKRAFTYRVN